MIKGSHHTEQWKIEQSKRMLGNKNKQCIWPKSESHGRKEYMSDYWIKNKDKLNIIQKKWKKTNKKRVKENIQKWNSQNKERIHGYQKKFREANPIYFKEYHKLNPRSNTNYSPELQESTDNVRKRDNNTCQWQGCGLTHRETIIHVHHIFPKSEYPDWELIEQYMICYCQWHHGLWHRYRGDYYANLILKSTNTVMIR